MKESKKLKELREEFNAIRTINNDSVVELSDVFDSSKLLAILSTVTSSLLHHSEATRKAIDLYLTVQRTKEEIYLVRKEVENITEYYSTMGNCLDKVSTSFDRNDQPYDRGSVALLWELRQSNERMSEECSKLLSSEAISDSDSDSDTDF